MHNTLCTALFVGVCCLGLIFIVRACVKVRSISHNHYRITGDEVRDSNSDKGCVI